MLVSFSQEWGKTCLFGHHGGIPPSLRMGARRPSGRPGTRWLRVDRKPLSTERPGPTRVAPADRARRSVAPCRWSWTWLPVAVCRCGAPPHGPAAFDDCAEVSRSDVLWWTRPNLPAVDRLL